MNNDTQDLLTARIPADVEQPDKIVYGWTARQVVILAVTGLLTAWIYLLSAEWLPLPVIAAAVFPMVAVGCALAMGRRDGMGLDRFVLAALGHARRRRTLVAAPDGVLAPPAWCRLRGRLPAPLRLPVRAVREDGVMDLADGGTAVMVRAETMPFALRTAAEQAGVVASFGRWLNSLDAPVQILMQTRPVDLSGLIDKVTDAAPRLTDPALEQAALDHAGFLADLNDSRDLLTRQVLVVVRDDPAGQQPGRGNRKAVREASASVVIRRAEEATRSLAALGISSEILDAAACTQVLTDALSPGESRPAGLTGPDEPITTNRESA